MNININGKARCIENATKLANDLKKLDYPVLSKKQERELIDKYANDRTTLNNLLILHNARMVYNMAKKYSTKSEDFDEMLARGFLGLAIAANRFELDRDIKFSTYAYMWIFKYIIQEFSDEKFNIDAMTRSIDQFVIENDEHSSILENFIHSQIRKDTPLINVPDEEQHTRNLDLSELSDKIYQYLKESPDTKPEDIEILKRTVENKESIAEVSASMDLPQPYVKQRKNHLLSELREMLSEKLNINSFAEIYA